MSLREEDRQRNNCPSRGLGLAAAAIGVSVGAALYYFFSKRPENPDEEGSTSGWTCEQPHAFNSVNEEHDSDTSMENQCNNSNASLSDSEYTTVSEATTTDTSMHDTESSINSSLSSEHSNDSHDSNDPNDPNDSHDSNDPNDPNDSHIDIMMLNPDDDRGIFDIETYYINDNIIEVELPYVVRRDSADDDWDILESTWLPEVRRFRESPLRTAMNHVGSLFSPRGSRNNQSTRKTSEQEQMETLRAQAFRERSWSLEECSICFEIMLKDQDLTKLPCAHNFHSSCLAPWLTEQQTCPNCREACE